MSNCRHESKERIRQIGTYLFGYHDQPLPLSGALCYLTFVHRNAPLKELDIMAGLIGSLFSSPVFTWWNSATFGTRFFTSRKGEKVGEDATGNIHYREKGGKRRWVIYKNGPIEASRVPPEWHAWLHYTVDDTPVENPPLIKDWEKDHLPNLTGSAEAYQPGGSLASAGDRQGTASDYEAWTPGQD